LIVTTVQESSSALGTTPTTHLTAVQEWTAVVVDSLVRGARSLVRGGFTVGLFVGGAYLVDNQRNVYWGLLLVGWSFARASTYLQSPYRLGLGRSLLNAVAESRSNSKLELYLRIDAILEHPRVGEAFERLQRLGRIPPVATLSSWRTAVVERFRSRAVLAPDDPSYAKVVFEVRSGQLWKDGEYRGTSVIFHEILIEGIYSTRRLSTV
jgi:hypothetical protein